MLPSVEEEDYSYEHRPPSLRGLQSLDPDLVFYCPFCARKKGKPFPFKTTRTILASPEAMVFRCDPALLIVTLTLPDANRQPLVTNLVKAHVSMWYEGNMEAVHMLRVPVIDPSRKKRVRTKEVKAAEEFLRKNELCKIVVIVNTHATQDGTLVNSCEGTWLGPVSDPYGEPPRGGGESS
ncbi:hypothetical protein BDM02DRAFT_3192250 [Thelephora ganbajun]|uniref:Uncharacterized protein n=1 Tax=Thelephora ganbajun TaxID=370292 RepID=A0ACB6Z046_THEGA|nr:hypothetical protein BDM02DRAFT_3192250 [Thelephora ganbajun]